MPPEGWAALEAHIAAHPVEGDPVAMRAAFARLAPPGPTGEASEIGGVPVRSFGAGAPVVWIHGGGLVFGAPATHAAMCARIASVSGTRVIVPAYRRAPDHPWPAPLEDALAVVDALGECAVGGDSAGGLVALHVARSRQVTRLALISPNTDRTGASRTRAVHSERDLMNDDGQDARLGRMAFGREDHPDASPLHADLTGLPPTWITAGTGEVLLDDTLLLVRALGRAGVAVEAHIADVACHLWPLWPDATPEARTTLACLARFLA
ncbi:MAG: alpha/beta hydrolase fold domain-containing protein [Shimia sp.]